MDFVTFSNVSHCSLPHESLGSADEICKLVKSTVSCRLYVNLINFMEIIFCDFQMPIVSIYGLISAIQLTGLFCLLFMLTKYFFIPNLVTLIEFASMTQFGFSYLFFGPILLMPYYMSDWPSCDNYEENLSPVQFAKLVGDIMRYFLAGVMVMCMQGYRADGVTLWSCVAFVFLGVTYLWMVTSREYYVRAKEMVPSRDGYLLEFRVIVFLFTFGMVLLVVLVVSHATYARSGLKKKERIENFSDMVSNDEILGIYPKQRIYSRRHIWLKTVNGNQIMKDSPVLYRLLMIPFFFIFAHIIPVISKDRILVGWVKYINSISLLALPLVCLFYDLSLVHFFIILVLCWSLSIMVFISTHSMRRPDYVWCYALLGLIISSVFMCVLCREIENLTWQYIGLQFHMKPDLNALIYFGLGEMLTEALVVMGLQRRKMWDASFGVVMSLVTYAVFLAFPLLYYQDCYTPSCKVIVTASTETAIRYMILIVSMTLLHISMSGYEFRISLFFYLLGLTLFYLTFQWLKHHSTVFPLARLHNIK